MGSTENLTPFELGPESDDVEAHGLKEVAAGLGAAAILGGAGAGAALAATSLTGPVEKAHKTVHSVQQAEQTAKDKLKPQTPPPPHTAPTGVSVDVVRTPTQKPIPVHLPHVHVNAPQTGAALQQTTEQATEKVQHAKDQTSDKARHITHDATNRIKHLPPTL